MDVDGLSWVGLSRGGEVVVMSRTIAGDATSFILIARSGLLSSKAGTTGLAE